MLIDTLMIYELKAPPQVSHLGGARRRECSCALTYPTLNLPRPVPVMAGMSQVPKKWLAKSGPLRSRIVTILDQYYKRRAVLIP